MGVISAWSQRVRSVVDPVGVACDCMVDLFDCKQNELSGVFNATDFLYI